MALALAVLPLTADAAGLGRLTVASALGQPLRAEIDLTASREEMSSLSARLASSDAFKNAGIEYAPALASVRFALEKRQNGQAFLVVTSDRPFNEPFVDMLVEVTWAAGRLVREYTFLLDPPDVFNKPAGVPPVAVPEVKKEAAPSRAAPVPEAGAPVTEQKAPESPRIAAPAGARTPAKSAAEVPAGKPAEGGTHLVKKGDTLAKIAGELKPAGVNLDQMLVALFRSNKDVFDGGNMNRLRAGKILTIPDKDAAPAVMPDEARRIVVAQAVDFNDYRKKLAALALAEPAKAEAPTQAAAGKITPRVEEKTPPVLAGKDKLEVSRTETGKGGKLGARIAATEEDLIARDKALNEANLRIAQLEKNLADLKKLAEMKSAAGAKLQESAAPAKPAEPAQPVEAPKPPESAPPPAPAETKPLLPPPPAPAPGFVEENAELFFGGGAIIAILLGYLGYNAWRRKRKAAEASRDSNSDAEFSSNSVFGSASGQSIDTGAALPTDFSQDSAAGMAGDEGVDPVAEADVYMAYGRDTQAEEILLEALKTDPTRRAIHLKLLEIYAVRKSVQPFATIARDLHGLTGGAGPDWEKAATLGRSIDPGNALYGGVDAPSEPDMAATMILHVADIAPPGTTADQAEAPPSEETVVIDVAPAEEMAAPEPAEETHGSLDFDLDLGTDTEAAAAPAAEQPPATDEVLSLDFDLDLGAEPAAEAPSEAAAEPAAGPEAESAGLDFDLGMPAAEAEAPAAETPVAAPPSGAEEVAALDFDFDLGEAPVEAPAETKAPEPPLDLSAISLELDETPAQVEPPAAAAEAMPALELPAVAVEAMPALELPAIAEEAAPAEPSPTAVIEDDPEVATKLELAQAYEEMGDKEGARELLNEVLNEGSPAQQETARAKLAQLA